MFGLFKKTKRKVELWELMLLNNVIKQLPKEYEPLALQVSSGLFNAALIGYSTYRPKYVTFSFNTDLINAFENKKNRDYRITGIKVYDILSKKNLDFTIYVYNGVIGGYIIEGSEKYNIDFNKIDTRFFSKIYLDNKDFKKLSKLLSIKESKLLNPGDVYEVVLNGKIYYHIRDLEDGDFIGIDTDKIIYKITHDPFEIISLNKNLEQVLDID